MNLIKFVLNIVRVIISMRETKVTKEKFHAAKKPTKNWVVNVDNIVTEFKLSYI